jgi:glucose/arabinose dehydrogenase
MGLERIFRWFSPERPTHLEEARDGSARVYVSEQVGRLTELTGDPTSETGRARTVMDITSFVTGRGTEEGFLGFALHPDSVSNRHIYVYYSSSNPRRSVISEFTFDQDGVVDLNTGRIVMEVLQPASNHNGGMLAFGQDGYLYISLGDGGGAGDQSNNAQNTANVLGTILRIDVDAPGVAYAVPPDNPFAGQGSAAPQIWAYGLRNPWRFSFDLKTDELWTGDVGQNQFEEIDLIERGGNYGWRLKEGPDCFNPSSGCEQQASDELINSVASYSHGFGCSVSGGYVYRGSRMPSLYGAYVYAICSGIVWALRVSEGEVTEQMMLADTHHQVPAFGQTLDGEVYMLTYSPGIFRFVER